MEGNEAVITMRTRFHLENLRMMIRTLLFLSLGLLAPQLAVPLSAGPLPPGSTVAGKTLGEWSGEWWKWVFSFPAGEGPLANAAETTGLNAGGVFLLSASGGSPISFEVAISPGQYLFVPLVTTAYFFDPSIGDTLSDAQQYIDFALHDLTGVYAELDGVAIPNLSSHWEASPLFFVTFPPGGIYNEGTYPALAGGYWLMLEPLPVGRHTLKFGGQAPSAGFAADTTTDVNVVPEPASMSLTAGAMFALLTGGLVRRRRNCV